jgi:hypothetical protein
VLKKNTFIKIPPCAGTAHGPPHIIDGNLASSWISQRTRDWVQIDMQEQKQVARVYLTMAVTSDSYRYVHD